MGALTKDVSETTLKIRQMEARVTSIESDLIKLGLLRNELQLTKSQLQDVEARVERNEMKNGIYFDAYRLENIKLYSCARQLFARSQFIFPKKYSMPNIC